jgi:hypothetical protein
MLSTIVFSSTRLKTWSLWIQSLQESWPSPVQCDDDIQLAAAAAP